MNGRKIQQLREAMTTILGEIGPQDFFTVIEFSSSNTVSTALYSKSNIFSCQNVFDGGNLQKIFKLSGSKNISV